MVNRAPTPSEARTLVSCRASVLVALASHLEQHADPPNEDPNSPPDGFDEADVARLIDVARPSFPWLNRQMLMDYVTQHRKLYLLDQEDWEGSATATQRAPAATTARGRSRSRGRPKKGAAAASSTPPASGKRASRATKRGAKTQNEDNEAEEEEEIQQPRAKRGRPRGSTGRGRRGGAVKKEEGSGAMEATPTAATATDEELLAGILSPEEALKGKKRGSLPADLVEKTRQADEVNRSENKFYEMIDLLKQFRAEKGHSRVPDTLRYEKESKYYPLAKWVMEVRRTYKNMQRSNSTTSTMLNPERITALTDLGFEFRIIDPSRICTWEERLEMCEQFKAEHGHLCIPVSHPILGQWCSHMRTQHKINREGNAHSKSFRNGKIHKRTFLTPTREKQLNDLGFVWQVRKRRRVGDGGPKPFEVRFKELQAFKDAHGHLRVTRALDPELYGWVCYQRSDYRLMMEGKKHHMTADKLRQLNEIGFVFATSRGGGGKGRKSNAEMEEEDEFMQVEEMASAGGMDTMGGVGAGVGMAGMVEEMHAGNENVEEEEEQEEDDEETEDEEDEEEDDDDELEDQDIEDDEHEDDLGAPDPHMF